MIWFMLSHVFYEYRTLVHLFEMTKKSKIELLNAPWAYLTKLNKLVRFKINIRGGAEMSI